MVLAKPGRESVPPFAKHLILPMMICEKNETRLKRHTIEGGSRMKYESCEARIKKSVI
jgi:hypothetical protein